MAGQQVGQDRQGRATFVLPVVGALAPSRRRRRTRRCSRTSVHRSCRGRSAASTPSVSAARQAAGLSRSRPRSSAKWLRVPALITRNGRSCAAAIPATSACVPSPPATPSRSRPGSDRLPGHCGHVHGARAFQQRHLGSQRLGLVFQPELGDLAAAGPRVHDQERVLGGRNVRGRLTRIGGDRGQREPGGGDGRQDERDRHHSHPEEMVPGEDSQHRDRSDDHGGETKPPQHSPVGEEHITTSQHQARPCRRDDDHGHTRPSGEANHDRCRGEREQKTGAGEPASGGSRHPACHAARLPHRLAVRVSAHGLHAQVRNLAISRPWTVRA